MIVYLPQVFSKSNQGKMEPCRLYYTDWTGFMSMSLVSILPMLLIFVYFQRYFVQGIAGSGMK